MANYLPVPQPEDVPIREREDAMGAYFMMFASLAAGLPLPIINLIAAVIYLYVNKSKSRFVHFHSLQSLYSQLPTSLMNAVLVFWSVQIFILENFEINDAYKGYVLTVVLANLVYFVFSIIAAIRARKGRFYYFAVFGKLAYHQAYRERPEDLDQPVNQPPI